MISILNHKDLIKNGEAVIPTNQDNSLGKPSVETVLGVYQANDTARVLCRVTDRRVLQEAFQGSVRRACQGNGAPRPTCRKIHQGNVQVDYPGKPSRVTTRRGQHDGITFMEP